MLSFICLFFPAVLFVAIWQRYYPNKVGMYGVITRYAVANLLLNTLCFVVLLFVSDNNGGLAERINNYNDFAIKYILLSTALALAIPYGFRFFRTKIEFSVEHVKPARGWFAVACCYAAILIILHFVRVFHMNFWGDEAFTIRLAKLSVSEMIKATAADVHPPLYYLFVQISCWIFGQNHIAYHLPTFLAYVFVIWFALTSIWKKFGKECAFVIITMWSLMDTAITYNAEVRMYAIGAVFVFLSFYKVYDILQHNRVIDYVLFTLFSLCAAYTHYYCLISVAFYYVVLLIVAFLKKKFFRNTLLSCVATVAIYLPWLFVLLQTFSRTTQNFWATGYPGFKESVLYLFRGENETLLLLVFAAAICMFTVYEIGLLCIKKNEDGKFEINIRFSKLHITKELVWVTSGLLSIFGTIIVGILVSELVRPMFLTRYVYGVSLVAWFILAVSLSKLKGKKLYSILLVALILTSGLAHYKEVLDKEVAEEELLAATLNATVDRIEQDHVILTSIPHVNWTLSDYYYPGVPHQHFNINSVSLDYPKMDTGKTYWLILYGRVSNAMHENLTSHGFTYEEVVSQGFMGVNSIRIYKAWVEGGE